MSVSVLVRSDSNGPMNQLISIESLLARLKRSGTDAALDILYQSLDQGFEFSGEEIVPVLIELSRQFLGHFDHDQRSASGYASFDRLRPDLARDMFQILMEATFPDGNPDLSVLNDATIVVLAGLLSAAGAHENAVGFLKELAGQRAKPSLKYALWRAECRAAGYSERMADYWPDAPTALAGTFDELSSALDQSPLDAELRRAVVRCLFELNALNDGIDQLSVGLSLPIADDAKIGLAQDLAIIASLLFAQGGESILEQQRLQWALAAYPASAMHAAEHLDQALRSNRLPFLDSETAERAKRFFRLCAGHLTQAPETIDTRLLSPYPMRNGKPHIDIVWLEITNFCNQKCSFCPDPFREEARNWLPLDQVKKLIDELAETTSVGSMQLNAYGEPLLHPHIAEVLAYLKEKQVPWPTFFTSHGLTLVDKKLKQLSHNYPSGIAISLHNDSQASYAATRSAKIGDYDTLVARVTNLIRQMVFERAACHMRLYQMVCNGDEDQNVNEKTRQAFPDTAERMLIHVRAWEKIAADIAASAPHGVKVEAVVNTAVRVEEAFYAPLSSNVHLPIIKWLDEKGSWQQVFMSARPVNTYANLLLEYDPKWNVKREIVNKRDCGFVRTPSLAIFATGRLGICCMDLNSTATFGSLSEFGSLRDALQSPAAMRMFAELSNGVATSKGCQICLASDSRLCRVP